MTKRERNVATHLVTMRAESAVNDDATHFPEPESARIRVGRGIHRFNDWPCVRSCESRNNSVTMGVGLQEMVMRAHRRATPK